MVKCTPIKPVILYSVALPHHWLPHLLVASYLAIKTLVARQYSTKLLGGGIFPDQWSQKKYKEKIIRILGKLQHVDKRKIISIIQHSMNSINK